MTELIIMDAVSKFRQDSPHRGKEIEDRARALVATHHYFIGRPKLLEFDYKDDVLFVRGVVPTFHLKQLAQCALKSLEADCPVNYQIEVATSVRPKS